MPKLNIPKSEVGILFDDIISEYKKGNVSLENIEIPFDKITEVSIKMKVRSGVSLKKPIKSII